MTACRLRHLSLRTEKAYVGWVRRYVYFHDLRHPAAMGAPEIRSYLTYLATERNVAASTQNQALHALLFLYQVVLEQPFGDLGPVVRARRPKRLPVVLTREEVSTLLRVLQPPYDLLASLLYGSGLRLLEGLRLRDALPAVGAARRGRRRTGQLARRLADLTTERARESNRLHAGKAGRTTSAIVIDDIEVNLRHLQRQIEQMVRQCDFDGSRFYERAPAGAWLPGLVSKRALNRLHAASTGAEGLREREAHPAR